MVYMHKITRLIEPQVINALDAFPVVFIAGPRQSGKTTLVQKIIKQHTSAQYITFDDLQMRSAAQYDPDAFLKNFQGPVVLDEIQMVPELFRPLKIIVDENRKRKEGGRGQFLLTGSASVMALPQLSDALVGRMSIHTLLPFSVREIFPHNNATFIDRLFSSDWPSKTLSEKNIIDTIFQASFPELLTLQDNHLRYDWCNSYLNTLLQRDVRALMEIEKITAIPDLLRLFAARTGGLINEAALSRDTGLNHITVKRYRNLLDSLFLTLSVPAWSKNIGKRLIKSPKIYLSDVNLLGYLLNTDLQNFSQLSAMQRGQLIENFVAIELNKQITFSHVRAQLYHYRSASQQEVDFIIEGPGQCVVGIEVKAKNKAEQNDFRHLMSLQAELNNKFHAGFVVYMGSDVVPFGKNCWAVPLAAL